MSDIDVKVPTYWVRICVGFGIRGTTTTVPRQVAMELIGSYCTDIGLCVTVTDTTYVYKNGHEPGIIVGLCNYPRFPSTPTGLLSDAYDLGRKLLVACQQCRVTIETPYDTIMLTNRSRIEESEQCIQSRG
jgi:hypothetical protein